MLSKPIMLGLYTNWQPIHQMHLGMFLSCAAYSFCCLLVILPQPYWWPEKIRERAKERYRLISMGKSMKLRKQMKNSISECEITGKQANSTTPMADSTTAVDSTNPEPETDANTEEKKDN
ncbi:hypothetical protein DOY81_010690 [Sarcophaga bullata]|nr:hypothetical protein DOY81_010690 [Sarcophaga bullata]